MNSLLSYAQFNKLIPCMHTAFMTAALEQAWLGRGLCAPNPSVGAIVVHNHEIIARDWHRGAGSPHAEQRILANLPEKKNDLTLYVTLEPCNHWGKTPPCVNAIIEAGIKRVVFGFKDPNPIVVNNNTPMLLEGQGVEVIHYPLPEVTRFYQSYQHWTLTNKPWVTAKIAHSFDGKIAQANGSAVQLSNEHCHQFTHLQRRHSDIILTSARTINLDNPQLTARLENTQAKALAIIDTHNRLSPDAQCLSQAQQCHIYHGLDKNLTHSTRKYYRMPCLNNLLDLDAVITHIGALGYHDVWVEAGGRLFSALHQKGLVQRTYLYLVPKFLGPDALSAYHDDIFLNRRYALSWHEQQDNMIACVEWQEDECLQD